LLVALGSAFAARAAQADEGLSYEVREQVTAVVLPTRDFAVGGTCSTGTGIALASTYAQGGSGGGAGIGAGLVGRFGWHYRHTPNRQNEHALTWWGFRAATGLELDLLYARAATGLTDVSGRLCARVTDGLSVESKGTSALLAQIPLVLGGELGLGTDGDRAGWNGVVLGAAWAPTLTYLEPWVATGAVTVNVLAGELTLDFLTLRHGEEAPPSKRLAVSFVLPVRDDAPFVVSLGFGVVWH
jgi:hypothetical protein